MLENTSANPPGEPAADDALVTASRVVDILLGLALVLLALNHVREFFSDVNYWPSNLSKTVPPMFFTLWVTYMSVPMIAFLIGTKACLSLSGGMSHNQLSTSLMKLGLLLILLEVTLLSFGWSWQVSGPIFLQLFWTVGVALVAMAGLIYLPLTAVAGIGLVMLAGHNLLDPIKAENLGDISTLWMMLHAGGKTHLGPVNLYISYPIIPWVGIVAAGFAFGPLLVKDRAEKKNLLVWLGLGLILAFVALRLLNGYGDKHPWETQDSGLYTLMSFVNTSKYPPSLLFLLMTIGPSILMIPMLARLRGPLATFLGVIGRVPFFYVILNLYLVHVIAVVVAVAMGGSLADMLGPFWAYKKESGFGFSLPIVYLAWLAVLAVSYPVCRWYLGFRERRAPNWLGWL